MRSYSDLPALDPPFKSGKGMISRVSPFTGYGGGGGGVLGIEKIAILECRRGLTFDLTWKTRSRWKLDNTGSDCVVADPDL